MERTGSRRSVLLGLGALALGAVPVAGCDAKRRQVVTARPGAPLRYTSDSSAPDRGPSAETCRVTEPNIEGPYYRHGAPRRSDLRPTNADGTALLITGRVLSLDCRSVLGGAVLDVWHADAQGRYDNDGHLYAPPFLYRGVVEVDARGEFRIQTVVPGRYLNGRQYRPAHVHVKVAAARHQALTTQLYVPGDPYNADDPFIRPSLVMDLGTNGGTQQACYDFVLAPAS